MGGSSFLTACATSGSEENTGNVGGGAKQSAQNPFGVQATDALAESGHVHVEDAAGEIAVYRRELYEAGGVAVGRIIGFGRLSDLTG